jgi:transcription initiation factor IIE alpha subunit
MAKLTDRQVLEIRRKYSTGQFTHKELAKPFGMKSQSISMIVRRVNWRHI